MLASDFNLTDWLIGILIFVIAITIHEFAHAWTADRAGDPTPRSQGRVSLNPVDHIDPIGLAMMALSSATGVGVGWGRPVPYRPGSLRRPRWDPLLIAVAGPVSNALQALVYAGLLRLSDQYRLFHPTPMGHRLLELGVWINLALALFNLIPIPPLDGSKVLSSLLPLESARRYDLFMAQWSLPLFALLVFTHATSYLIGVPLRSAYDLLLG